MDNNKLFHLFYLPHYYISFVSICRCLFHCQ
jgi:hypothetical protein